jgi:L-ribulose-5-phosphate 4-epimerase
MLEVLKIETYRAILNLQAQGLILLKWGNVSVRDPRTENVVIKPGGISYKDIQPRDMVVCDMMGNVIEGGKAPSSDLFSCLEVYRAFPEICSIVHMHARWATVFAQAGRAIPTLGTTHTDRFAGDIPVTRNMTPHEMSKDYYKNIGRVIVETQQGIEDPMATPAVLVRSHGPFVWGTEIQHAVENAVALEFVAEMAYHTLALDADVQMSHYLIQTHSVSKKDRK